MSFLSFQHASISAQIKNAGNIISYKKIPGGIEGKTTNCIFDVHVYNDNIIRVRVSQEKSFRNFSYALADNNIPSPDNITITEKDNHIFISTNAINTEIQKSPSLNIVFRNKKNEIINADVDGQNFGTTFNGNKVNIYKKLQEGERFVGLGEALGNLDRRGSGITLNNTDNYKYGDPRVSMYSSIPFYMGMHHNMVYGLFFNNSYKSFFNFGLSTSFTSVNFDGGEADYFFMYDTSVVKIIAHYTSLTGRMQLPPLWSLGYQQSRCTYYPQDKVMWIAETFRRKNIPVDGIVLDADYQLGYEPFRTNTQRFPDMPKLSKDLAKVNIELTASVYPGVNIDSSYDSYNDGLKKDVFIKSSDGNVFKTEIAPLKVLLPDYTNPTTRQWWIDKMQWMKINGINGYWNDMNEPAVGGSYLPDNLVFDFDGRKASTAEAKNLYGFQMARSSYEAALKNNSEQRPFVLTRSGFAGVQRYSGMWSGDNMATDEGLLTSVLLNNQFGLSGVPFIGYDIGGYIGDGSKNLYTRWIEVGIFSPYCRNHREFFGAANEPWAYGEEAEAISKTYIGFRYRLMPYLYAAFYEASQTGMPVQRSLCIDYPFDDNVYDKNYQYQFLFGKDILITPLTSSEKSKNVYLPQGDWYNLYSDEKIIGSKEFTEDCPLYKLPFYIKASAIIPTQSLVQSTKEKPNDTLYLHIYNGTVKNTFTYYEDEGNGFGYTKNVYCRRMIEFDPAVKKIIISKQEGSFHSNFKKIQLIFHGFDNKLENIRLNNANTIISQDCNCKLLNELDNLDDIYDPGLYQQLLSESNKITQQQVTIDNSTKDIILQW
ncbi:MAG TPA: glycoside hydrolase family 31 protein [Parafilimonas sp.]|nr:glycoside hydrolase family 31 protein [Parafilimonas sp.]